MAPKQSLTRTVLALRQSAICCNSAVASMSRVAAQVNPEKQLRCWTAERKVEMQAKAVKGMGK